MTKTAATSVVACNGDASVNNPHIYSPYNRVYNKHWAKRGGHMDILMCHFVRF